MQTALFVCNTIVFLYLFGQFYIKAYNKKNQLKSEQLAKQKELIMDVNANCVDPKEKKIKWIGDYKLLIIDTMLNVNTHIH